MFCQHIQDYCRKKCVTPKRLACDVGVTDRWAHWVKCKSLFCSPMWHLLSADDRLDDKDSLDIHDNPPLPDNVLKEEDNKVRRPISITCDASRGAVYSPSTQETNPLSFRTKLQTNCFSILFVDSLQICPCKYSESNTTGALVSSCFMRKFSSAKDYIYFCWVFCRKTAFFVHHKQYLLHLTVARSSEHCMVAPKTNYKQEFHQDLSSRHANLKLSVIYH